MVKGRRNLELVSIGYHVPWSRFSNWIGGRLEDFTFAIQPQDGNAAPPPLAIVRGLISIMIKNIDILKVVVLDNIPGMDGETEDVKVSFPNLEGLTLLSMGPSIHNFFSAIDSLKFIMI